MFGTYYIGGATPVAISTLRTILEFTAPTAIRCQLLAAQIGCVDLETSTQEALEFVRKSAAGTGTAAAIEQAVTGDAAFGGSGRYNCTAEGTVSDTFPAEAWNIVGNGYIYQFLPEERITVEEGGILGVRFQAAPEASMVTSAVFKVRYL